MLKVRKVSGGYENKIIVSDVSFSVHKGEFIGILGPNGSGKTTLLKLVSGALQITAGEIIIKDMPLPAFKPAELAKILAVLPQSTESSFSFTVKETVSFGRYPYQKGLFKQWSETDEQAVLEALAHTNLTHYQNEDVLSLSGGEKQRVFLAQALAQEPEIFLLDEPTNHLDLSHQKGLMDLLKLWTKEKQMTVVSVFHDLNLASLYCDRLILMDQGTIVSIGSPWEVLTEESVQRVYHTDVRRQPHPNVPRPQLAMMPAGNKEEDAEIITTETLSIQPKHIVFQSPFSLKTISSSVVNSGIGWFSTFINRHVEMDYNCEDSSAEMKQYIQKEGFRVSDTVAMMTAIPLSTGVVKEYRDGDTSLFVVVTAGIGGAVDVSQSFRYSRTLQPGTINIMIFVNGHLSEEAFLQGVVTATEAKAKVLADLGVKDALSHTIATGTATDSILLAATQKGRYFQYAGPITDLGKGIGKCVYQATIKAIQGVSKE
ncbi:iron complex transport system ATP-binding protein [Bacillus oleivorans]|uniref:Iron complex transport system ATP-binding protein n=1 Tax=Bacillus oleivorans TaxID=1448271 RepID=A0A285D2E8_9BACI|nr:adenosylcobinamide amidohydrolase [Bacillus oleivorans]SNX73990.1 iron complex transport system ATP-binding protein [Bacillus oleivorans]